MVLVGGLLNSISSGFYGTGFSVYFLPLSRDLGLSRTATSAIFGVARLEGGIEGLVAGYAIDRWGPRKLMITGCFVGGAGFLLLSLTHSYATFLLVYLGVLAFGMNLGFNQGVMACLNNWFVRRKGLAFSLMAVGISVGGATITPIIALLVLGVGWRTAALVSGVLVLALSLPLTLLMRSTPEEMGLRPDGDRPRGEAAPSRSPSRFVPVEGVDFTVRQAFRTWAFWLVALAITLRLAVHSGVFVHLVPLMVWKGTPERTAALMVGLLAASAGVGRLFSGWIGDRWSRQRVIAIGMVGGAISLVVLIVSGGAIWQIALFLVLFSSVEAVASLSWALIGEFFGRRAFATLRGVVGLTVSAGSMGMPIITGLVYDRTGSYHGILVPLAITYIGIAMLFWVIRPPRGAPAPSGPLQEQKSV